MKLNNVRDTDAFFELIESCNGRVELVTGEGDRLNLKSKLSQYVMMSKVFADNTIPEVEIVAYDPEDHEKIIKFMLEGRC